MATDLSTLGKRLKYLREELKYPKASDFAKAIDFGQSNLSIYENDKSLPGTEFYSNLKEAFPDININWLISLEGSMFLADKPNTQPRLLPAKEVKMLTSGLDTSEVSTLKQMNLFLQGLVDKLMNELSEKDKTLSKC